MTESGKAALALGTFFAFVGCADVVLDTPLFFEGGSANALMVKPTLASGPLGDAQFEVTEPGFASLNQTIRVVAKDAAITCE